MTKPHIYWIHGYGTSSAVWQEMIPDLPEFTHSFVSYQSCHTVEDFRNTVRKDIQNLLESATPADLHIIGWSMGGMLGIEALAHDDLNCSIRRLGSLTLIASSLQFVTTNRDQGWPRRIVERMRKKMIEEPEATVSAFQASLHTDEERAQLRDEYVISHDFNEAGLVAGLQYLLDTNLHEAWMKLIQQQMNIYWIHGMLDEVCPVDAAPTHSLADRIAYIPDAGHMPFHHQRHLFLTILRRRLGYGTNVTSG
ncbi:alpha/beta fold hydrolase [Paenibacillus guangzhouensis]|uniref:alpha/beta fold hydrolase n=1 Tax=Paenibacillus guangzhouensis TaxID=1473112 RepID=UPI001266FDCC|nr:alpha/beta fold hydrolase [Paenibacillus guangzhouensis]